MASKIRKFNGYHYLKAKTDLTVEDSTHESSIPIGETFLVGTIKGKYYVVDIDLDEKSAYRFLINKKTYMQFIEQNYSVQPAFPEPEILEKLKTLISDHEVTCTIDEYPEILVYVKSSTTKIKKTARNATFKIVSNTARLITSTLKESLRLSKTSQSFNNMKIIQPKDYRNTPKEQYFADYLKHVNSAEVGGRYSDTEAIYHATMQSKLDSHPLAGSKELKAYLAKGKTKEPEVEDIGLDDAYKAGEAKAKYKSRLAQYEKQIAQLDTSPIFANATEKAKAEERENIYRQYHPDYVKPDAPLKPELTDKELFAYMYQTYYHSSLHRDEDKAVDVKENDKSLYINMRKLPIGNLPMPAYHQAAKELMSEFKKEPRFNRYNPRFYLDTNKHPDEDTYYFRIFLFNK